MTAITYSSLLRAVQPRVIRDAQDHARALAEIDRLMKENAKSPDPARVELIDLLAVLIEKYERAAFPVPIASPVDVIRQLMEARQMSQVALAQELGIATPQLADILSGVREITVELAHNMARVFGVPATVFAP